MPLEGPKTGPGTKMLSLEKLRKIDPELEGLSDIELEELRASIYETVQLAYDVWWERRGGSKNPETTFTVEDV